MAPFEIAMVVFGSSQQKKPEAANEDPRRAELSSC